MRNIFLFIRRYFNFLFFVVLQITALYLLFHYNDFHKAAFFEVAHEITGRVGGKYNNVSYYFHLKKVNEQLAKENERLRNQLALNFQSPDTSLRATTDSVYTDTSGAPRKYFWRAAKVVNNNIGLQNNTLTIERGSNQGVTADMGVVGPGGIVGRVISTSGNYAVVMSVLNRQFRISSKLKKTGETGTVQWDGVDPKYVIMNNIPKNVPVVVGDSVVTSQYTYLFPPGILVGTVAEIIDSRTSNFKSLRLKTATNFYNVEHVMVVENLYKEEQLKLEGSDNNN